MNKILHLSRKFALRRWLNLQETANHLGFNWSRILIIIFLGVVFLGLIANIYASLVQAGQNYNTLVQEEEKLDKLRSRSSELQSSVDYFSSLEYKQRYAYDSLNMTRPGEQLYLVELSERESYELVRKNPEPIQEAETQQWWNYLKEMLLNSLTN